MKKKWLISFTVAGLVFGTNTAWAYPWAKERVNGLPPQLSSPLFGPHMSAEVSSSWNEPRTNDVHKGVDQEVPFAAVGPMWGVSRVLRNHNTQGGGGLSQIIRSYNRETGTTFYTVYFHLQKYLLPEGTAVKESDFTAVAGDSGSPHSPHIHYEILSKFPEHLPTGNALVERVSVNPHSYMNDGIADQRSVFKNYAVENLGGLSRRLHIEAVDFNLGRPHELQPVIVYARRQGGAWKGPFPMQPQGNGRWAFDVTGTPGVRFDYVFAGRRSATEYWVTYPATYSSETGRSTSGIPINNYSGWDYVSVAF